MEQEKKVILLAGPTGSGKSKLALQLAKKINGDVINADSMQIYKEFFFLTSRPPKNDTNVVNHRLYGFHSVRQKFSTGHWLKMAIKEIMRQWKNNQTPIVVGGTGLYFKALTEGLAKIPDVPNDLRIKIRELHKKIGQKKFYIKLIKLDPIAKRFLSPMDSQRSMRAYEVKKFTNKSLFLLSKETKPKFDKRVFKKLFIDIPKDLLHKKIDNRVDKMFHEDVVVEVKNFLSMKINKELSSNKIIGIKEIQNYIQGKATLIKTKELIKLKTRQYAKRQFTWARGHMGSWNRIYSPNFNDLFNKAIDIIS